MIIVIPPPSQQNTHFRPNYISAATQSMTVGLVSGTTTTNLATANLTTGSSNCSTPTGGGLQCTVTVQAPFGTDTFAVSTYSGLNGSGSLLSSGQVQVNIVRGANTPPTVQLDLDGVPASVALALGTATLPVGYAGSTAVIVQAKDASGNLIIGPGVFSTPISLAISGDTYNTLSLSTTSITSPGQVATLNYNGGTNVGATITPSGSGMTGTGVTFNATGGVLNLFQYDDTVNDITLEPYDVAAMSNGNVAIATDVNEEGPSSGIAVASSTGVSAIFVGDTSDFYNPPESGSKLNGVTSVHKMSETISVEVLDSYDDIAASGTTVYYSGNSYSDGDAPTCEDNELSTGTFGVLNSTAGTTTEYILQGYPGPMHVDSSGNVWFIERSGECGESQLISSEYAIGKFNGSTVTETPFSSISGGLPTLDSVTDMSITPDGSTMYIVDNDYEGVYKVATGSMTLTASVALNLTENVRPVATGPDSTTAWFATSEDDDAYPYGFVPGSKSFTTADMTETRFPLDYFEGNTMAYADGSFWISSMNDDAPGAGRLSGLPTSSPVAGYYPPPGDVEDVEIQGIGGGNGYVWYVDSCQGTVYALQYGVPSSGTVTYLERRIGTVAFRPKSMMHKRPGYHQPAKASRPSKGIPLSHRDSTPPTGLP
jgi:hypothetical protein